MLQHLKENNATKLYLP